MHSYPTEQELIAVLDHGDTLVRCCARGEIPFEHFRIEYDNLYWSHALDGHESDPAGRSVLAKYAARITTHQAVAEKILANVCSDADAGLDSFRTAGRFGPTEAVARIKLLAAGLPGGEA